MIAGIRTRIDGLRDDARGVTAVEFAIVAPVMCLLLMGALDVSHTLYTRAVLQGIVQKTARDSTLESGAEENTQTQLDDKVRAQAKAMYNGATIVITRRFYRTFTEAAAARAETYTDTNDNKTCDAGEPYSDANGNGVWDRDGGNAGQGGAKDATLYTVRMTYPRIVPVAGFVGLGTTQTVTAQTVLENQPYGDQASYAAPVVRNCT
ncbi:pilus assembly protein [Roseomonas aeriglobus]|nr:pilus assembly protein [Roseomonas aeriglobus]